MDSNQEAQIFYYLKEAFEKSNNFKLSYSATLPQSLLSFVHYLNSILRNFFPLIVWTELCMCLFLAPWSHFNHLTKNESSLLAWCWPEEFWHGIRKLGEEMILFVGNDQRWQKGNTTLTVYQCTGQSIRLC